MTLVKRKNGNAPAMFNIFDDFLGNDFFNYPKMHERVKPAVNISENDDEYNIELAVPGMKKKDFNVEVDNYILKISSENEEKHEDNPNDSYTRKEFSYSSFERSFTLPEDKADVDKINAKYEDGILYVSIPKKEESKPKPARAIKIG